MYACVENAVATRYIFNIFFLIKCKKRVCARAMREPHHALTDVFPRFTFVRFKVRILREGVVLDIVQIYRRLSYQLEERKREGKK